MDRYARRERQRAGEHPHDEDADSSTVASSESSESEVTFESVLDPSRTQSEDVDDRRKGGRRRRSNSDASSAFEHRRHRQKGKDPNTPHTWRELWGLTIVGAFTGCLIGGPICGAVGAGATAAAVTSHGKAGDLARKGGEAVARVGDEISKLDKKHKLSQKPVKALKSVGNRIKQYDENNQVSSRVRQSVKKLDDKYHIVDRVSSGGGCLSPCTSDFNKERFRSADDSEDLRLSVTVSRMDEGSIASSKIQSIASSKIKAASAAGPASTISSSIYSASKSPVA